MMLYYMNGADADTSKYGGTPMPAKAPGITGGKHAPGKGGGPGALPWLLIGGLGLLFVGVSIFGDGDSIKRGKHARKQYRKGKW